MSKLSGVITAIITPFKSNGELDTEGLRKNIQWQLECGIDGIAPLGTTGESSTLSAAEKEIVIKIAREETKKQFPLIVGTGSYSTAQTIENTSKAKDLGADYAMIVTPYYNRPTQEGFFQHFKTIAESVNIPIIIYNNPHRTGQNMQNPTLYRLAEIPNIVGVKEASGSVMQFSEIVEHMRKHRKDFTILTGDDPLVLPTIACGGHGVISVVSNLVPEMIKGLVSAALKGNHEEAREFHYRLMPLYRTMFIETNPIPLKAAMNHFNRPAGPCRLPLCSLTPENEKILKDVLTRDYAP